jgi:DNA-binding CsgD family transcriptional regulator
MRSRFWTFMEACDETQSLRAVRELYGSAMRALGIETYALVTHAPLDDLRSLGVAVHNWPADAIGHLFAGEGGSNPLFDMVEGTTRPFYWRSQARRDPLRRNQRLWINRLSALLGGGEGATAAMRSTIVSASCSVTAAKLPDPEQVRLCMRIAEYTYRQIQHLQRPQLSVPEQLTAREHEFLYRATVLGERPSDVAEQLGVKISTVRTLRQKAGIRLDSGSQEQAAWRMLETGQLFRSGRRVRPRSR